MRRLHALLLIVFYTNTITDMCSLERMMMMICLTSYDRCRAASASSIWYLIKHLNDHFEAITTQHTKKWEINPYEKGHSLWERIEGGQLIASTSTTAEEVLISFWVIFGCQREARSRVLNLSSHFFLFFWAQCGVEHDESDIKNAQAMDLQCEVVKQFSVKSSLRTPPCSETRQ